MYNTPGYIDVTQRPFSQEEIRIMVNSDDEMNVQGRNRSRSPRYPYAIVWTPIPLMTWIFPFLGHMGICTSSGVIRDFAGSFYVSEDNMAFGNPTRYYQLDPECPPHVWDQAISDAACSFKTKMHTLCWTNCHSMVAAALNNMNYKNSKWNAWKLGFILFFYGKFTGFSGFLKTFLPFFILVLILIICGIFVR